MDKEGIDKAFEHLDHGEIRDRGVFVAQDQRCEIHAMTHEITKHSHRYEEYHQKFLFNAYERFEDRSRLCTGDFLLTSCSKPRLVRESVNG